MARAKLVAVQESFQQESEGLLEASELEDLEKFMEAINPSGGNLGENWKKLEVLGDGFGVAIKYILIIIYNLYDHLDL